MIDSVEIKCTINTSKLQYHLDLMNPFSLKKALLYYIRQPLLILIRLHDATTIKLNKRERRDTFYRPGPIKTQALN